MSKVVSNINHSADLEGKEIITRCSYANMFERPFEGLIGTLLEFEKKYQQIATLTGNFAYIDTRNPLILEARFEEKVKEIKKSFPAIDSKHDNYGNLIPAKDRHYYEHDTAIINFVNTATNLDDLRLYLQNLGVGYVVETDYGYRVYRNNGDIIYKNEIIPVLPELIFWVQGVAVSTDIPLDYLNNLLDESEPESPSTVKKVIPWALLLYLLNQ